MATKTLVTKEVKEVEGKKDLFKDALKTLEERYGVGTVMSGKNVVVDYEVISTGSLTLDTALGTGGYPLGTLIEMRGPFSSGKSTLTLHAIANFQKQFPDDECVLMDGEHSYDVKYARKLGVNTNKVHISQPTSAEDMYNISETLIKTGRVRLIIIDSHTSFLPQVLIDAEVGKVTIAPYGRTNSVALGKLKSLLKPNRCTVIAISQLRVNVGGYGAPEKSTGGKAWEFYPDIKIKLAKKVEGDKELNRTTATVDKNKCAKPLQMAEFDIVWNKGIDRMGEIVSLAEEFKILKKSGSWFFALDGETKVANGRDNMLQFLHDNENFALEIESLVTEKLKNL